MAIRSHPGVQKMPASGISSELSAHQMARPGAIAHSRPTMQPSISSSNAFLSFFILLRLATPALGLGVLAGSWQRSEPFVLPFWSRFGYSFSGSGTVAFFQTLRRLLRQRLNFSTPSRVAVTSDLASRRHWSPSGWQSEHSCCRHGHVSHETTRQARALRTRRRAVSSRSVRRGSVGERRVTHSSILLNSPS